MQLNSIDQRIAATVEKFRQTAAEQEDIYMEIWMPYQTWSVGTSKRGKCSIDIHVQVPLSDIRQYGLTSQRWCLCTW